MMCAKFYREAVGIWSGTLAFSVRRPEVGGYQAEGIVRGPSTSLRFAQDDHRLIESLTRPGWAHHSFLAQEIPSADAAHLSNWLIDAAAVGAILLVFLKIIDHFKRKPSLEQELEKLLRQIRTELNQLRHEQGAHLSEVRSRVEGAHQRVDLLTHDLNNKLQRLPGEIVDLLHKTGVTPRVHL